MTRPCFLLIFLLLLYSQKYLGVNCRDEVSTDGYERVDIGQLLTRLIGEQIENGEKCISLVDFYKWEDGEEWKPKLSKVDVRSSENEDWIMEIQMCNLIFVVIDEEENMSVLDQLDAANLRQRHKLIVLNLIGDGSNMVEEHKLSRHLLITAIIQRIKQTLSIKISEFTPEFHWVQIPPFDEFISSKTIFPENKLQDMKGTFVFTYHLRDIFKLEYFRKN